MTARSVAILAALAASLVTAGVVLAPGEAVDIEASYRDPDAGLTQIVLRCEQRAGDAGLDCGDLDSLPGLRVHDHDTKSAKYTKTIGNKNGRVAARRDQCYCGPRLKPNQCRVFVTEMNGTTRERESVMGEYIPAGAARGSGCIPRPCWELTEVAESKGGAGYSMPEACR